MQRHGMGLCSITLKLEGCRTSLQAPRPTSREEFVIDRPAAALGRHPVKKWWDSRTSHLEESRGHVEALNRWKLFLQSRHSQEKSEWTVRTRTVSMYTCSSYKDNCCTA